MSVYHCAKSSSMLVMDSTKFSAMFLSSLNLKGPSTHCASRDRIYLIGGTTLISRHTPAHSCSLTPDTLRFAAELRAGFDRFSRKPLAAFAALSGTLSLCTVALHRRYVWADDTPFSDKCQGQKCRVSRSGTPCTAGVRPVSYPRTGKVFPSLPPPAPGSGGSVRSTARSPRGRAPTRRL